MSMITYADKETLNAQPSIADKNKCTANDMNEIKSVINNKVGDVTNLNTTDKSSLVNAINELKNAEIYSTSEVKTNKIWIDGKPIYKRVVIAPVPNNGQQVVSFSGWNVEHAILDHGKSYHTLTNNNTVGLDFYYTSTDWSRFYINANGVYCNYGSSLSTIGNVTLFIEYTKTTDKER